jgi:hypothetical protein
MSDVADKWGAAVAQRGFAQIPNYLLLLNQFLDEGRRLSPVELLVLLQLVGTWWVKTALPFPSMKTLATRCGVSDRQIQRAVNHLVKIGLLVRVKRRAKGIIASNAYDLAPLVALLDDVAKAFPNEFPRKVDKAMAKQISERLNSTSGSEVSDALKIENQRLMVALSELKARFLNRDINRQLLDAEDSFVQRVLKSMQAENIGLDAATPEDAVSEIRRWAVTRFDRDPDGINQELASVPDLVDSVRRVLSGAAE